MTAAFPKALPHHGRVRLTPIADLDTSAWRRVAAHFRDPEIAFLNGTPPNRMPLWLLRRVLRADARRRDRATFGILDERSDYIGTVELYDIRPHEATLGIIIGERSHWNHGYGPEAIACILTIAFDELDLERVKLHTYADNPRAQAAFRKIGFRELRRVPAPGGRVDVQMDLSRAVWTDRAWLGAVPLPPLAGPPPAEARAAESLTREEVGDGGT
ncbi:GNAT family N-acetyltransferase [soil metagenome]|nr:GNAT family N-acetyltransferase [Trueperaceae bacterium]